MAKNHTIKCTVSAHDGASAALGRVRASTIALGTAAGNLLARGMIAGMNAVRGLVGEVLAAEKANVMLDAALRGVGSYTPEASKQMRDLASAIQDETGASDEAVKSNIAMLTTLGVSTDAMGDAARAVAALTSLGRDGSQAMVAIGKALEGDISGFERFSPEVKNATTITEKYAAANKLLAAGYEQQKASLLTVGGSWAALKGRIGDAVEDIGNALTEGLKIGPMFNDMQAAVGKFLQSDTFKSFTDRLRDGADYVSQIVKAMATDGGATEVAGALGNVILGALKDGADYVGNKIKDAFGKKGEEFDPRLAAASRFWGALSGGSGMSGALKAMDKPTGSQEGGGNLSRAMKELESIVSKRVVVEKVTAELGDDVVDESELLLAMTKEEGSLKAGEVKALQKEAAALDAKIQKQSAIETATADIEAATEREKVAQDKITAAKERLAAASVGINEWINNLQGGDADDDEADKERAKAQKKAKRLLGKLGAKGGADPDKAIEEGGKKGRHLSKDDEDWLRKFGAKPKAEAAAKAALQNAIKAAGQEKLNMQAAQDRLEKLQERTAKATEGIETIIADSLTVN